MNGLEFYAALHTLTHYGSPLCLTANGSWKGLQRLVSFGCWHNTCHLYLCSLYFPVCTKTGLPSLSAAPVAHTVAAPLITWLLCLGFKSVRIWINEASENVFLWFKWACEFACRCARCTSSCFSVYFLCVCEVGKRNKGRGNGDQKWLLFHQGLHKQLRERERKRGLEREVSENRLRFTGTR